jgi:hypothetical protein
MNDADTDGDGASGGPFVGAAVRLWHVEDAFDAAWWVEGMLTEECGGLWRFEDPAHEFSDWYDL